MYARVVTLQNRPGKLDEVIQSVRDSLLLELQQEEGFLEFRLLVDRSTDKSVGIAFYQTEAHLQATGTDMSHPTLQQRFSKHPSWRVGDPLIEVYEVAFQG
jgi:quinol monooxygenase YgiN